MMRQRFSLTLAGLLLLIGGSMGFGPHAARAAAKAPKPPVFPVVLRPTDALGSLVSGPDYFTVTASPGTSTTLYAYVGNAGKHTNGISLTPVDGASGLYGGLSFSLPTQRRTLVGSWVAMSHRWISLGSQRAMVVPFTVTVPRHTPPGSYMGGLSAFIQAKRSKATGTHLILQLRSVNAIVVTVPGQGRTSLALKGIDLMQRGTLRFVVVHIRNTGTMPAKAWFSIWLWRQGKAQAILHRYLPVDSMLANTSVHYPVAWLGKVAPGRFTSTVQLTWQGHHGRQLTAHASFQIVR